MPNIELPDLDCADASDFARFVERCDLCPHAALPACSSSVSLDALLARFIYKLRDGKIIAHGGRIE